MTTRKLLTRRTLFIALPLLFAALALGALAAIQNTPAYTDAASPDWSRGALIGSASLVNPIALAPEPQGGTSLVWVDSDAERNQRLHYARLNAAGEVVVSQPLALPQPRPETPTLFRMDDGAFQLFYLAPPPVSGGGSSGAQPLGRALYRALISSEGRVLNSARVSPEDRLIRMYSVVNTRRAFAVFYSNDDAAPGVYYLCVGSDGAGAGCDAAPPGRERTVAPAGTRPNAAVDEAGQIHLAWFERPSDSVGGLYRNRALLYYARFNPTLGEPIQPLMLTAIEHDTGVDLKPPQIAMDRAYTTIAWVQDKRGGRGNLESRAFYVSFPLGKPVAFAEPVPLTLANTGKLTYTPYTNSRLTALALPAGPPSNTVNDLQWLSGQTSEVIGVALVGLRDKQRAEVQVATLVMAGGQFAGYQLVNRALLPSNQPSLALDAQGRLQLAWLDSAGGEGYGVRYASTDPQLAARWGRLDARDVAYRGLTFFWNELSFLPFAILSVPWLFLPLLALIVRTLVSGEESLAGRGAWAALIIAIALHLIAKTALLPPLPDPWAPAARLAVLAVLPAPGLLALWGYLRRVTHRSTIVAYLCFAAVDILTSLFVYMPLTSA